MTSMYYLEGHPHPRWLGGAVGFTISAIVVVTSGLTDLVGSDPTVPTLLAPTLIAGTIGGALLGPRGARSDWQATRRSRFGIRIRLALAAVVVGAFVMAGQLSLTSYLTTESPSAVPVLLLLHTIVLAILGMVLIGWLALPFTYGAALAWTWAMKRLTRTGPYVVGNGTHAPSATPRARNSG